MKFKIAFLVLVVNFTFAQTIVNCDSPGALYGMPGYYFKDINNVYNQFEGDYLYTNGNTSLLIKLRKKEHSSVADGLYFEDLLIGSYRYIENGVEKVNVLDDINTAFNDGRDHKIYSGIIRTGPEKGCPDCEIDEKRLWGTIDDPVSGSVDRLNIRKTTVGGQEAIKIIILHAIEYRLVGTPAPPPVSYPLSQEIILIKQL